MQIIAPETMWILWKKEHFFSKIAVFTIVNRLKKTPKTKIHGDSPVWNHCKKTWKNGKSLIFQKSLTSLKRVQIAFWIVEKIAEECFNPNPKDEKNS